MRSPACGLSVLVLALAASLPASAQMPAPGDQGGSDVTLTVASLAVSGEYFNIGTFTINSGATLTLTGPDALVIIIANDIVIDGTVDGNGLGAVGGTGGLVAGPAGGDDLIALTGGGGGGGTDPLGGAGGGGGGHGADGGAGADGGGAGPALGGTAGANYDPAGGGDTLDAPPVYTDAANKPDPPHPRENTTGGAGGGAGGGNSTNNGGNGGNGGGAILLIAFNSITIGATGVVTMDGTAGAVGALDDTGGGGGGAGGGILLCAPTISGAGTLSADGADGGAAGLELAVGAQGGGGGGGGGSVKILADTDTFTGAGTVTVALGKGGLGTLPGLDGSDGTIGVSETFVEDFQPLIPTNSAVQSSGGFNTTLVGGEPYTNDETPILLGSPFVDRNTNLANDANLSTHNGSRWLVRPTTAAVDDYDPPTHDSGLTLADLLLHETATLNEGRYFWIVTYQDAGSLVASDGAGAYSDLFSVVYSSTRTGSIPGSVDPEKIREFTVETSFAVDLTAPPKVNLQSPPDAMFFNTQPIVLDWSDVSDPLLVDGVTAGAGVTSYDLEVLDEFLAIAVSTSISGSPPPSTFTLPTLTEGRYTWHVRSADAVGNTLGFTTSRSFSIDLSPPTVPTLLAVADDSFVNQPVTLDWSDVTDPLLVDGTPGVGLASYDLQVASDAVFNVIEFSTTQTGSPPTTEIQVPSLPPGTHYWRVRVQDTLGNVSNFSAPFKFGTGGATAAGGGTGSGSPGDSTGCVLLAARSQTGRSGKIGGTLAVMFSWVAVFALRARRRRCCLR